MIIIIDYEPDYNFYNVYKTKNPMYVNNFYIKSSFFYLVSRILL